MKKIAKLLIAFIMIFSLTACNSSKDTANKEGTDSLIGTTYELTNYEIQPEENGEWVEANFSESQIIFGEDGTVSIVDGDKNVSEGSYVTDGKTVTIKYSIDNNEGSEILTIDGDTLQYNGMVPYNDESGNQVDEFQARVTYTKK